MAGATIQVTGNYQDGQDVLSFANTGNITGTWDAATGKLTLSGSDTVANYQAALQAVKYQNTSDNPSAAVRTVSFTVNDGVMNSNALTRNVTVTPVINAPVLAGIEAAALSYTEKDPATPVTATIIVSDADNADLAGATIQITGNYQDGQDVLSFANMGNITGTWDAATGKLTLSGSDTVANYQAALRAVKYQNTSATPTAATRTVSFSVNDGAAASNVLTRSISVTPVDDAPVLAGIETTALGYTENDPAMPVTATISVSDADNASLVGATIQITGNYQNGQDVLSFADMGNITGTWDAATGKLTLSGSDTVANYQAALRAVQYQNSSDNPSAATRTVSITVNDGTVDSGVLARDIAVTPVNDAPVLAGIEAVVLAYTEKDPATALSSTITVSDVDNANLAGVTVRISGNYQPGQDVLSFANTATITGTWDALTGTLTLSGSDTVANYQAALRAVEYQNTSDNPSAAVRTVSFTVGDGAAGSNVLMRDIAVTPVNDAPVLDGLESPAPGLGYLEKDPATPVASTITVGDADNANLAGATVWISSNYQPGQDVLSFADTATITATWNAANGTLTLGGDDSVANYQAALQAVKYQNTSDNPIAATRTVSFRVNDGAVDSNILMRSLAVTAVNDPPVLAGIEAATLAYTENDPATLVTVTITASDVDNADLAGATIQITGNYQPGQDVLSFVNTANITGTWDAATGTLTLTGSDTVANYQSALRAVRYQNTSDDPSAAVRTVSFTVNDGAADSNALTRGITVTPVNDAPALAGIEAATLGYIPRTGRPLSITSTITVSDADNADLAGATIQITGNYQDGQDVLSFANMGNITGTWDAATGKLTLSGSDTVANYQAALRAVKYQNTSATPIAAARTVSFSVSDGAAGSNALTRDIALRRRRCWPELKPRRWLTRKTIRPRPSPRPLPSATWLPPA